MGARLGPLLRAGYLRPWVERILDRSRPSARDRCLDAMCDGGMLADALARAGGRVLAVDESPAAVDSATATVEGAVRVLRADCAALPVADGEVDVVTSLLLAPLARSPRGCLAALRRVVRPRTGRLSVVILDESSLPDAILERSLREMAAHRSPFLEALLHHGLGGQGSAVRDVARFDSIDHYWTAMVDQRPIGAELGGIDQPSRVAIADRCAVLLAPFTGADGTLRVPMDATLITE